jgi:predicted phosphodiesterase
MRIAIFSDVHGNARALEAVLDEVRARGPFDRVINAGDLVFGGPRPRETMALLLERGYPAVVGNTDEWVAGIAGGPGAVVEWTRRHLLPEHLALLRGLPRARRVEPPGGPPLVVVHATPESTTESVMPDAPAGTLVRMLEQAQARALAYGHVHRAYVREVEGGLVVNAGSVGFPFDGDPRPAWAIATLSGGRWSAEVVRVAYDREAVARDLLESDHPDAAAWARRVRTGTA